MGDEKPTPQPRGGLSLYANLLDPSSNPAGGTISSAPVRYNQTEDTGGASQGKPGDSASKAPLNSGKTMLNSSSSDLHWKPMC